MFRFKNYYFNQDNYTASFNYEGADGTPFCEEVKFAKNNLEINKEALDRALFLSFILIGTSYYKARPTRKVALDANLDDFQAKFFNRVYQEGLSQFAFENQLKHCDLAMFTSSSATDDANPVKSQDYDQNTLSERAGTPLDTSKNQSAITPNFSEKPPKTANFKATEEDSSITPLDLADYHGILSLQSGGKDSLLTASLLSDTEHSFWYLGSSENYPDVLNQLDQKPQIATRHIDIEHLKETGGLNGHVPITYIVQSLALVQAILNHQNTILTSIGREGNEPHAYIDDLPVNHQWSKTWLAEQAFAEYVHRYISPNLNVGSPLRGFSELRIAEFFVQRCWRVYGHQFSSCNVANYRQKADNHHLSWCGNCAKCANSYLLFAPFVKRKELDSLFAGQSLFEKPDLQDIFKGLLGIDGFLKPFECIGEITELRCAYHMKQPEYPNLSFSVPKSDFNYKKITEMQPFVEHFAKELE